MFPVVCGSRSTINQHGADGNDQFLNIAEDAAAEPLFGKIAKKASTMSSHAGRRPAGRTSTCGAVCRLVRLTR
jgi:hypothetical protein